MVELIELFKQGVSMPIEGVAKSKVQVSAEQREARMEERRASEDTRHAGKQREQEDYEAAAKNSVDMSA